jgi:NTP pyrophosphatase (non-canonical NTP hydrolase)
MNGAAILRSDRLRAAAARAVAKWGQASQLEMVTEECAELIAELNRAKRGRASDAAVAEEAADVYIALEYIRCALGSPAVAAAIEAKLTRLEERLG